MDKVQIADFIMRLFVVENDMPDFKMKKNDWLLNQLHDYEKETLPAALSLLEEKNCVSIQEDDIILTEFGHTLVIDFLSGIDRYYFINKFREAQ
jgi:hypothetical protein